MKMTCIPLNTLARTPCHSPTSLLKSRTQTMISPSV